MNAWLLRRRTIPGLLGVLWLAAPAFSQFAVIGAPWTPTDLTPVAGDYEGRFAGGTPLVMGWTQFLSAGGGMTLKPLATQFVVCIDPVVGASPPPCSRANADFIETIAAPTMALTRNGSRFTFIPRALADSELDRPLRLTVGACSAPAERNCAYSGVNVYFATVNPASAGVGQDIATTASNWKLNAQATNDADGSVPRFSGLIEIFEVLGTGTAGRDCVKNADDPTLVGDPTLVVLDKFGGRTPMPMVPRNGSAYSGPDVVGIFRMGSFSTSAGYVTERDPSLGSRVRSATGVKVLDFPITGNPLAPRTFVIVHSIDTANAIREFNETDNAKAACRIRQ